MENEFRWIPPRDQSIAFRRFKHHHTMLNRMYWAHVPAHLTIQHICKEKTIKGSQQPLDFFVNKDENDRRVETNWSEWSKDYCDFLAMTRLNFLLDMNSYFEIYLYSIFSLAMESRPDVLIRRPYTVDGLQLLKKEKKYRLIAQNGQPEKGYMFKNQLFSLTTGDWPKRIDAFRNVFGEVPEKLKNSIDELEEIRKKRNSVGHGFARKDHQAGKIVLISEDKSEGISEEKLKEAWRTINEVAISIDDFLLNKFIGSYEFIAFYLQHWGKSAAQKAEELRGSELGHINSFVSNQAATCRRCLGEDGYQPIQKTYSESLIRYYWFEI